MEDGKKNQGDMEKVVMQCRGFNAAEATDMVKVLSDADVPRQFKMSLARFINEKVINSTPSTASAHIVSQKLQSCQVFCLYFYFFALSLVLVICLSSFLFIFAFMHSALIFHSGLYVF